MNSIFRMSATLALAAVAASLATPLAAAKPGREGWTLQPAKGCAPRVEHVAAHPTYDAEARAAFARDPMLSLKPGFHDMPAHLRFDLAPCYDPTGMTAPALRVLPVAEYERILDNGSTPSKYMTQQFDALRRWIDGPPDAMANWPMIPFLDMSPQFTLQRRALRFRGGRGIRVVTQFVPDVGFATSRLVSYVFQGLTDDGRTFVLMTVPLTLAGAAADDAREHLGFTLDAIEKPDGARDYEKAVAALFVKNGTTPPIAELDALIESLARDAK